MPEPYRLPTAPPTAASTTARDEWSRLVASNLAEVRAAANRWRDGLAALVTLVTAGLVVSGPDSLAIISTPWRLGVVALLIGGLLLAVAGLVFALRAAAGRPRPLTFETFAGTFRRREALDAVDADAARQDLQWAQRLTIPGLVAIVLGTGAWLLGPSAPQDPPALLEVTTATERLCGTLRSGDDGALVLAIDGERSPTSIARQDIVNLRIVAECPSGRAPA